MKISDPRLLRNQKPSTPGHARPGLNPDQIPLIDTPRARNRWDRRDPETSFKAAQGIDQKKLTGTQEIILWALRQGPAIDEELVGRVHGHTRISPQSIRSRRAELVRRGLVVDSGKRRRTQYGNEATVWRLA
jgi:hypothetical protein